MAKRLHFMTVGAGGNFAELIVPDLVRRGCLVRGFAHSEQAGEVARRDGATQVVIGDLRDHASVDKALQGMDRVFYIAPAFQPDEADVGINFVDACVRAGVKRIVFSSVIHPILSALGNHAAKGPVEEAILDSGVEFTFLHPALFYQNYAAAWPAVVKTGVFSEPYSTASRLARVDYRDVAEAAAIALTEDRLMSGTFELCAEGLCDRHEMASFMGHSLGRPIKAAKIDFDEWAERAKVPAGPARDALQTMYDWYDAHGLPGNSLTLRAILGREPRTLQAFFDELAKEFSIDLARTA